MISCKLHLFCATLCALSLAIACPARADEDVPQPLDMKTAIRIAKNKSQAVSSARAMAQSSRLLGDAEGRLPDPEVMAEAWQVPVERPLALRDASMVSVGVRQSFPAPGVLSSRTEAREADARVYDAALVDRARTVERDTAHAFVDLQVASARHAAHAAHRDVASQLVTLARARMSAAGGRLTDLTQAQAEQARLEADVTLEAAMIDRARAKLNGLLRRPMGAPLVTAPLSEAETVTVDEAHAAALAETHRPEIASARMRRAASEANARAASSEASLPTFTVGAAWYAPTTLMPFHGYGVSVGATIPWLWGSARTRERAATTQATAEAENAGEIANQARVEAASALTEVRARQRHLLVLTKSAKPASDAAFEASLTAYQAGQGDASAVLRMQKDVSEVDVAVVEARAALAHALADLDWAVGTDVPHVPLGGGQ